jgi:hypothetical protein
MKEVIYINDPKKNEDRLSITHCFNGTKGWVQYTPISLNYDKIVYLGKCSIDGDMFAAYPNNEPTIIILRGHLNSGKY